YGPQSVPTGSPTPSGCRPSLELRNPTARRHYQTARLRRAYPLGAIQSPTRASGLRTAPKDEGKGRAARATQPWARQVDQPPSRLVDPTIIISVKGELLAVAIDPGQEGISPTKVGRDDLDR